MNLLKIIGLTVFAITISLGTAYLIMYIQNKQGLFIDINGTILTFVGILATFIVVGNYAQVVKIENDLKEEIQRKATKEARKVAADVIKQSMKNNKISIKDDDVVNLLVHMASTAKNVLDRKEYLEAALEKCDNDDDKKKIQSMIDATQKAIDNNYLPDIL